MPPRAMWTGQLRLSLVSFGVRMYAATESSKKVSMNQLHKDCHQRVRNQLVCPTHGPIGRDELVKGYEYEKDSYVIIDQDDLDGIRLESNKTIEIVQFVDMEELDPMLIDSPYFIGPDGPVAEEAYSVIREAMKRAGKVAIGKLVMSGRERIVALRVEGKGFLMTTLRYPDEVRKPSDYFSDIRDVEIDEEQLALAGTIMDKKAEPFDPRAFQDRYRDAFFDVVKAKVEGAEPIHVDDEETPAGFNFMDALRQSVADAEGAAKKPAKKSVRKKPAAGSVSGSKKKRSQKRA